MFMDALASVQFQDVTRQQIEHTADAMVRLDEHMSTLAQRLDNSDGPELVYAPLAEHLEQIYSRYVMDQQRQSHDTAIGRAASPAAGSNPNIELF